MYVNTPAEAYYPAAYTDAGGETLDGLADVPGQTVKRSVPELAKAADGGDGFAVHGIQALTDSGIVCTDCHARESLAAKTERATYDLTNC